MRLRDVFFMAMALPTVSMAQSYRFAPAPYQLPPPPNNMSMTTPQRGYTSYNAQQAYAIVRSAAGAGVRNAAVRYGAQVATQYGYESTGMFLSASRMAGPYAWAATQLLTPNVAHAPAASSSQYRHW
jgi:hypothetical protein